MQRVMDVSIKPAWQEALYERQSFINNYQRTPESAGVAAATEAVDGAQERSVYTVVEGQVGKWVKRTAYHVRLCMTHRLDRGIFPVLQNQTGVNFAKRLPALVGTQLFDNTSKAMLDNTKVHDSTIRAMGTAQQEEDVGEDKEDKKEEDDKKEESAEQLRHQQRLLRRSYSDEGAQSFGFAVSTTQTLNVAVAIQGGGGGGGGGGGQAAAASAAGPADALVGEAKIKKELYDALDSSRDCYTHLETEEARLQHFNAKILKIPIQTVEKAFGPIKSSRLSVEMNVWEDMEKEIAALKKGCSSFTHYKPWSKVPNAKKEKDFLSAMHIFFGFPSLRQKAPLDVTACCFASCTLECLDANNDEARQFTDIKTPFSLQVLQSSSPSKDWLNQESFYNYQVKYGVLTTRGSLQLGAQLQGDLDKKNAIH